MRLKGTIESHSYIYLFSQTWSAQFLTALFFHPEYKQSLEDINFTWKTPLVWNCRVQSLIYAMLPKVQPLSHNLRRFQRLKPIMGNARTPLAKHFFAKVYHPAESLLTHDLFRSLIENRWYNIRSIRAQWHNLTLEAQHRGRHFSRRRCQRAWLF